MPRLSGLVAAIVASALARVARASPDDDRLAVAPDAGAYFVFHAPTDEAQRKALHDLPEVDDLLGQLASMTGVNLWDPNMLSRIGVDDRRPVVVSWGIVEETAFARALAWSAGPEPPPPFAVRFWLVVPVIDAARAEAQLDAGPGPDRTCARRQPGDPDWTRWLARLHNADDERAALAADARYICVRPDSALVARSDRAHRELQWTVAIGPSPHVAEAAARLAPDASFDRHLREAGILSANVGFYTWPRGEARARAGLALVHLLVAVLDIPAGPARSAVWRGGVRELEGASRLVESPPRLLSSLRVVDRTATWTLTPEGRTFFASLKLPPGADVMRLRKAIAATLRPQGVFRSPAELDRTFEMYGGGLRDLLRHFVWPHRIAMGALHPRERSLVPGDFTGDRSTDVTLDLERGELRLREQDTAKRE
jgi:hypothetical protein